MSKRGGHRKSASEGLCGQKEKKKNVTHVVCKAEHDLRCAIPPRRDIFGHEPLLLRLIKPAGESKIANLELAVRIDEQVARLEIAVQHVG